MPERRGFRPKPSIHSSRPAENPWFLFSRPERAHVEKELRRRVQLEFVMSGPRRWDIESQLVVDLYDAHLQNRPYGEAFQEFLNLFTTIDQIHRPLERANKPRSILVLNALQKGLIDYLSMDHAEAIPEGYGDQLNQQADQLVNGTTDDVWYNTKLEDLQINLASWENRYKWIRELTARYDLSTIDIGEVKRDADSLLLRALEERGYGIRNSYFHSPMFLSGALPDSIFIFADPRLNTDSREVLNAIPAGTLVVIFVAPEPMTEHLTEVTRIDYTKIGKNAKLVKHDIVLPEGLYFICALDSSGVINSNLMASTPIRRGFDRVGAADIYEVWRLFMIARFYDLTSRAELVNRLPQIEAFEREVVKSEIGFLGRKKKIKEIPYKSLLAPRMKPEVPEIRITQDEAENGRPRRFVDRHKVSWFVRRLPQGYHASVEARLHAEQHGVKLREGETIVREHYRGKERKDNKKSKPTRAFFRN